MAERLLYFMLGARALVTEAAGSEGPHYDTTRRCHINVSEADEVGNQASFLT